MSAEDLALFLRQRMGERKATNTEMVKKTNLSRRTWYRLLNADIEEAKLSTLIKLANALDLSVSQLVDIYFNKRPIPKKSATRIGTNLPANSIVSTNQVFTKTWEIRNFSNMVWSGLTLRCIDETLEVRSLVGHKSPPLKPPVLKPSKTEIILPTTQPNDVLRISIDFTAPDRGSSTISHWRFYKDGYLIEDDSVPHLDCLVMVVENDNIPA